MDRNSPMGGVFTEGGSRTNPVSAKVEDAAQAAHQATDRFADGATARVDRLSGTAHRAVNTAANAASSAADWVAEIPLQAKQVQAQLTERAGASIRARPIAAVAGALFIGYLLGRLGRR